MASGQPSPSAPTLAAGRAPRRARAAARAAHPGARRRHGHDDPDATARRERTTAASASRDWPRDLQGQQRPPVPHAARRSSAAIHAPTSKPAPTSSRPTPSTSTADVARRLRHGGAWSTSSTWPRRGSPATRPTSSSAGDPSARASWPACSGPTNRTASLSPDVNDPGFRNITFDELVADLHRAGPRPDRGRRRPPAGRDDLRHAERQGGDLRDRERCSTSSGIRLPVMISGTITDASGRTLSGQTTEAFWNSVAHAPAAQRGPQLRARRQSSCGRTWRSCRASRRCYVSAHPNAGLPERLRRLRRDAGDMAARAPRVRRAAAG